MNNRYDVICPFCGAENKGLYLEETDGVMECEECGQVIKVVEFEGQKIPICMADGCVSLHHTA